MDHKKFLSEAEKFQLGHLMTEASHEKTRDLSEWSKNNLDHALSVLKEVDVEAIEFLRDSSDVLVPLQNDIAQTLADGNRIFISGCGATGRLALTLETLWRQKFPEKADAITSFMAGGDVALIRSIESFEDHWEFGERQLAELGFTEDDLLIAVTEGGETTFVIGTAESAAEKSRRSPYFVFCNPSESLQGIERSARVLADERIQKIELAFGPMSLSGSTRLQASTVQLLAVASCLFSEEPKFYIEEFLGELKKTDFSFLKSFIEKESSLYQAQKGVVYSTNEYGMTILTDTTERSPTFSLSAFENFDEEIDNRSLCYFHIKNTTEGKEAWRRLLLREPRALDWQPYLGFAGPQKIPGYDFSDGVFTKREGDITFHIDQVEGKALWKLEELEHSFDWQETDIVYQHLLLKVLLNIHSTLLMGRLGRYEGNWMTWVKPSNGKLIDRATRYILGLAEKNGKSFDYDEVVEELFVVLKELKPGEPIVLKTFDSLLAKSEG